MFRLTQVLGLALSFTVGAHTIASTESAKLMEAPQLRVYGQGNCKPNRPQWEQCDGADFHSCQQACLSSDKCIGFDYDPAFDGCCRVRLTSNLIVTRNVPPGFTAIEGDDGFDFNGTSGSNTATCYSKVNHASGMLKYGKGNCAPNRPQKHGFSTFAACQQSCLDSEACVGFDYDPAYLYCRTRYHTLQAATTSDLGAAIGLTTLDGIEGPGFAGTDESQATCYIKPDRPYSNSYDLLVYGSGNCKPDRPQWAFCDGSDFKSCQQTCLSNDRCIGFDYDAAYGGCCRIRFSWNDDIESSSKPPEYTAFAGEEGPGFSGSSGPASATCYVKPNHPSSTTFDLFIYGPGNCEPARPQWSLGNPATFGNCQQTCLTNKQCMGFDYDPAFGGFCRIRFATNDVALSLSASISSAGFTADIGQEGYGFTNSSGQHGTQGSTCYVKPMFPAAAAERMDVGKLTSVLPVLAAVAIGIAVVAVAMLKIVKTRRSNSITIPFLMDSQEEHNAENILA